MYDKKAALLEREGAWVSIVLLPPQAIIDRLKVEGKDVPYSRLRALIDTGAESTSISEKELISIGLISRNMRNMIDSSGDKSSRPAYDVIVELESGQDKQFVRFPFEVSSLHLDDIGVYGLIGRDLLRHFDFNYNGPVGGFSLRFDASS